MVLVFFSHGPVQLQFFCSLRTGPLNTNQDMEHPGIIPFQGVPWYAKGPHPSVPSTNGQPQVSQHTGLWADRENTEHLGIGYIMLFRTTPSATVRVSRLLSISQNKAHRTLECQPLVEYRTPWNYRIPGCSVLYQGPTFRCPVCHMPATGVTWHTGLWANHRNTRCPGMG